MDISSVNNSLSSRDNVSPAHQNYVNIQGLEQLKQQAREDQRSALQPVAEQFEALFVEQVFKESRKVSLDDNWLDGNQGDFYKDWHDKQLAQNLSAKGTLGFADKIVEQLTLRQHSIPEMKKGATEAVDETQNNNLKNNQQNTTEKMLTIRNLR